MTGAGYSPRDDRPAGPIIAGQGAWQILPPGGLVRYVNGESHIDVLEITADPLQTKRQQRPRLSRKRGK